jgi:putative spermidine/putrescine transport system ATP-binding protein
VGTPQQVYDAPATRFVAHFVGAANVLDGLSSVQLTGLPNAMLRPERIRVGAAAGARADGVVQEVQYFGAFTRIRVDAAGALLQADLGLGDGAAPSAGDQVHLHWDERAVHALGAG